MTNNKFYKYRPVTSQQQLDFVMDILFYNKLHLSEAKYFTDPFEILKYEQSKYKIISLTTSPDNILLWSFYASWHQGIMIEFEFDENCKLKKGLQKITYTDNYSKLAEELKGLNYFIKDMNYTFEEEWRYITDINEKYFSLSVNSIKSITLGASIEYQFKKILLELCLKKNIICYEYNVEHNLPKINEEKRLLTSVLR